MWERDDSPMATERSGNPPSPPASTVDEDPPLGGRGGGGGGSVGPPRAPMERQGSNKPTLPPLDGSFYGYDQADEARIKHFMQVHCLPRPQAPSNTHSADCLSGSMVRLQKGRILLSAHPCMWNAHRKR